MPEPRLRLGGIGTPQHEALNVVPVFSFGISAMVDVDENDPPTFEAQATYLERHGLLLPGERKRLKKADFEP